MSDYASSIAKIQPKYQEALNERAKFQAEREAAVAQATTLSERIEARLSDIVKLKEEKASLGKELADTQRLLRTSSVPDMAQLEQAKEAGQVLQAEKIKLEKKVASMTRDFEFTRDAYQKASNSAVDLANELSEVQQEMTVLRQKADENSVRIAELQRDSERQQKEDRITELEALLADRENELWRKGEELKIKTNGRRETRATSVPRSPRLTSGAMSPRRLPHGGNNGSRQNSPVPGEMPRIREGFGVDNILFPPRQWGHLREEL